MRTRSAAVVLAGPLVAGAVLAALRPGLVVNAAGSPLAWATAGGLCLLAFGGRALLRRSGASPAAVRWLPTAVVALLVLALVAPSFRQRTLVEPLPDGVALVAPGPPALARVAPAPAPAPASAAPTVRSGELFGIGHRARGTVSLQTSDGATTLVFQDVNIEGTIDPSVHLVPPGSRTPADGVRLGALKAERGTFSYRVPADVAPGWSVLVWCDPYDTPIAAVDPV